MKVFLTRWKWRDPILRLASPSLLKGSFSEFNPKTSTSYNWLFLSFFLYSASLPLCGCPVTKIQKNMKNNNKTYLQKIVKLFKSDRTFWLFELSFMDFQERYCYFVKINELGFLVRAHGRSMARRCPRFSSVIDNRILNELNGMHFKDDTLFVCQILFQNDSLILVQIAGRISFIHSNQASNAWP